PRSSARYPSFALAPMASASSATDPSHSNACARFRGRDSRPTNKSGAIAAEETTMKDVAVVSYCRTGIAKAQRGALNMTHGIPMAAHVLKEAVARAKLDGSELEDVVIGCGIPEGATGHNIGRNAALEAGFGV